MQQHTGQHILSQAFVETCDAETVAFHLGADASTIDLDRADLGAGRAGSGRGSGQCGGRRRAAR